MRPFSRFFCNLFVDFKIWLYLCLLLQAGRVLYLFSLREYLCKNIDSWKLLDTIILGLQFDIHIATCFVLILFFTITLPSLLLRIEPSKKYSYNSRIIWLNLFTLLVTFLYMIYVEYWKQYKNYFDQNLFEFFNDDKLAILHTIYLEHNLLEYLLLGTIVACILSIFFRKLIISKWFIPIDNFFSSKGPVYKILSTILVLLLFTQGFNGQFSTKLQPIKLKSTDGLQHQLLIASALGPFRSLTYAFREHITLQKEINSLQTYSLDDIQNSIKIFYGKDFTIPSVKYYMKTEAKGAKINTPKHIFVIIGESFDTWPLESRYSFLNISERAKEFASSGLYVNKFIGSGKWTFNATDTIITGLLNIGMKMSTHVSTQSTLPTAIAYQFKKLGYKTQFFYGGSLTWRNMGALAKNQGFDHTYGSESFSCKPNGNWWGVEDHILFEFIKEKITLESQPTFNLILTTSNHPPFTVNLSEHGFPQQKVEQNFRDNLKDNKYSINVLGHRWYADHVQGKFIDDIEKVDLSALFVITGDHYGHSGSPDPNPSLLESMSVPLIIYRKGISEEITMPINAAGGHIDIGRTLVEMVAPKGFEYHTMGQNLLEEKSVFIGLESRGLITSQCIIAKGRYQSLDPNKKIELDGPLYNKYLSYYKAAKIISWWRLIKGDPIKL